jgi:hypothetical protein
LAFWPDFKKNNLSSELMSNGASVFISLARKLRGQHINFCSQVIHKRQKARESAIFCDRKSSLPRRRRRSPRTAFSAVGDHLPFFAKSSTGIALLWLPGQSY